MKPLAGDTKHPHRCSRAVWPARITQIDKTGTEWLRDRNAIHAFVELLEFWGSHIGNHQCDYIAYDSSEESVASEPLAKYTTAPIKAKCQ